ncbi:ATP-dependent DNA helicase PIF1 [Sarotherodon galilaeus]
MPPPTTMPPWATARVAPIEPLAIAVRTSGQIQEASAGKRPCELECVPKVRVLHALCREQEAWQTETLEARITELETRLRTLHSPVSSQAPVAGAAEDSIGPTSCSPADPKQLGKEGGWVTRQITTKVASRRFIGHVLVKNDSKVPHSVSGGQGSRGALEPIPAVIRQEAGYTLDRSPVCRRANIQGQTTIRTHIHT